MTCYVRSFEARVLKRVPGLLFGRSQEAGCLVATPVPPKANLILLIEPPQVAVLDQEHVSQWASVLVDVDCWIGDIRDVATEDAPEPAPLEGHGLAEKERFPVYVASSENSSLNPARV